MVNQNQGQRRENGDTGSQPMGSVHPANDNREPRRGDYKIGVIAFLQNWDERHQ